MEQKYEYTPLFYPEPTPVKWKINDALGYSFGVAFHDFIWTNWERIPIDSIIRGARHRLIEPDEAIVELDV